MNDLLAVDSFSKNFFFLSNFYPSPIEIDGKHYKTVEHYYQSFKSADKKIQKQIRECSTPRKAKNLGKKVKLRSDWNKIKLAVMEKALVYKFKNKQLMNRLYETAPAFLVEGNTWHDNYWGNCSCPRCKNIYGKNALGILLMTLRDGVIISK